MIKRFFVLVISILFLCACTPQDDTETITFSSWGSVTEVKIIKKVLSNFEKENPNIKVQFLHIPQKMD